MKDVIAVDLDGTLAEYTEWKGVENIGKPVPAMVNRIKRWMKDGKEVRIFTARLSEPGAMEPIKAWLDKIGLGDLDVTNIKGRDIMEFWDDRAVPVEPNTGKLLIDPQDMGLYA